MRVSLKSGIERTDSTTNKSKTLSNWYYFIFNYNYYLVVATNMEIINTYL